MKLGGFIISSLFTAISAVFLNKSIILALLIYMLGFGLYTLWVKVINKGEQK
jgi:hypothetical protein